MSPDSLTAVITALRCPVPLDREEEIALAWKQDVPARFPGQVPAAHPQQERTGDGVGELPFISRPRPLPGRVVQAQHLTAHPVMAATQLRVAAWRAAPSMTMARVSSRLRAIAEETVGIIETGRYQVPGAGQVVLASDIAAAVAGTRLYLPDDAVAAAVPVPAMPVIEVTGETTLAAARRLGGQVACLVFASARKPGGGFLNGAEAQEESLARSSALHACLCAIPEFYSFHRQHPDLRYSDPGDLLAFRPGLPRQRRHVAAPPGERVVPDR